MSSPLFAKRAMRASNRIPSPRAYHSCAASRSASALVCNRRAQEAASNLRAQDEQARSNLIAQAQAGLDTTTATQMASSALRNNLEAGQATSTAQGLGDVFSGFSDLYAQSRKNEADREAMKYLYRTLYSTLYGTGG